MIQEGLSLGEMRHGAEEGELSRLLSRNEEPNDDHRVAISNRRLISFD
jgi:hypothetical protein